MRCLFLLIPALVACTPETVATLPHDDLLAPPALDVSAVLPGRALTAVVTGLTTGTAVSMRVSTVYQPGTCASRLYGECLEVGRPSADASAVFQRGSAVPSLMVPNTLPIGAEVFVQIAGSDPNGVTGKSPAYMRVVGCGDAQQTRNEACDDGNVEAGDGCSPTCDVEPETELELSGFGLGRCIGACRHEVSWTPPRLNYGAFDDRVGTQIVDNGGRLTLRGERRRMAALLPLDGVSLLPVYGCPNCFDQGEIYFDLISGGAAQRVRVDPTAVPAVLSDLEDLRIDVSEALATCTLTAEVVPGPACVPN